MQIVPKMTADLQDLRHENWRVTSVADSGLAQRDAEVRKGKDLKIVPRPSGYFVDQHLKSEMHSLKSLNPLLCEPLRTFARGIAAPDRAAV